MGTLLDLPLSATTLRPRDENLTENLVDDTPLKTVNPLAKRDYIKVGYNEQFSVRPSIVHFGGYDVKSVHRTTVRITNTTSHSKRIVILPPNTPFFKATCNKKGLVAPGMSEDVRLEFCPTEWRYYYDCIRVHSESENLIVPIHAYPVMNDVIFPVRIDFGKCAADQLYTKKVKLECKVPIQFEFNIQPLTPGGASLAAVRVAPASGFVPADGAVEVEVSFHPTRLVTYVEQFLVTVSQFNSEPLTCTVTGCAVPCKVRDDAVAGLAAGARGTVRCGEAGATMQELEGVAAPPAFRPGAGNPVVDPGGGAGRGDAYTRAAQATMKAVRAAQRPEGPIQCKMPEFAPPEEEVAVRGVMVQPRALHTQAGVQAVLLQQDGKLRMKDLQKAIDDNHRRRQKQQESMESGASQGLGWIEDEDMSQQIKEMIFAKEFSALVDYEREVELKFGRALGGVPPSEEEVQDVEVARHYATTKQQASSKLNNQHRYQPERGPGRGAHFAGVQPIPGFSPDFDVYKNRDFERRRQVVDRLRLAVRRVLVRTRAAARLAALNRLLNSLHRDKAKVQAACNEPTLGGASSGAADVVYQQPPWHQDKVREHVFPVHLDSNFRDRAVVEEAHPRPNEVWLPMPLKVPLRYKLHSYTEMPFSPFPAYLETRQHQPLMQGAEEEEEAPAPRAALEQEQEAAEMPHDLARPRRAGYPSLSERMNDDTVTSPPFPLWGLQDPHRIQPSEFVFSDSVRVEVSGSNALASLNDTDMLSEIWLPRREDWLMEKIQLPRLMKGAQPEDIMEQDLGFEPHAHLPPLDIKYPTAESIAADFFVPKAGQATPPAVRERLEAGANMTKDVSRIAESAVADDVSDSVLSYDYEIPRQRREAELDRKKREKRDTWVEEVLAQKTAFNELVSDSRYQFQIDRPGYPARP